MNTYVHNYNEIVRYEYERRRKLQLFYVYLKIKRKRLMTERNKRKYWVRPIFQTRMRQVFGVERQISGMRLNNVDKYVNYIRMTPDKFDELLYIIGPSISKLNSVCESIPAATRLLLPLRYFASGDSMVSLSYAFRIGQSTVSYIISETCNALWNNLSPLILKVPDEDEWKKIAEEFEIKWNFPNCVSALDGKHVIIQAPDHSGSTFYNYKGLHSICLLAMCDANYCFTIVDIGAQGQQSDGGIFRRSDVGKGFKHSDMKLPPPRKISANRTPLPYTLVVDEAFLLTQYLLRPYPRGNLTMKKRIFNYRLSRARRVIENTFGILTSRWRIYRKPIIAFLQTVNGIVKATVCLHNWLKKGENNLRYSERHYCSQFYADTPLPNGDIVEGSWRVGVDTTGLVDITHAGSNTFNKNAGKIREEYTEYFFNEGAVEWQWSKVSNETV